MSGECEKCGEHALECKCYERCKCNKHPATHPDEFNMLISEFGMLDVILEQEIDATCKDCGDKFYFKRTNTVTPPSGTVTELKVKLTQFDLCQAGQKKNSEKL